MRQAQLNVRTRACSRTSIARTKQAALTHNVRGKEEHTSVTLAYYQMCSLLTLFRLAHHGFTDKDLAGSQMLMEHISFVCRK